MSASAASQLDDATGAGWGPGVTGGTSPVGPLGLTGLPPEAEGHSTVGRRKAGESASPDGRNVGGVDDNEDGHCGW